MAITVSLLPFGVARALTDDTGVIDGLNQDVDAYSYLNTYNYHLWKSSSRFLYASEDNQVLIAVSTQMKLRNIFILGGGYKTDKGIQVGDSMDEVLKIYGPVYDDYHMWSYANTGAIINYYDNDYYRKAGYSGYLEVYYRDLRNSAIYFIINRYTKKVALIMYQADMHGASHGVPTVAYYDLLPRLD